MLVWVDDVDEVMAGGGESLIGERDCFLLGPVGGTITIIVGMNVGSTGVLLVSVVTLNELIADTVEAMVWAMSTGLMPTSGIVPVS